MPLHRWFESSDTILKALNPDSRLKFLKSKVSEFMNCAPLHRDTTNINASLASNPIGPSLLNYNPLVTINLTRYSMYVH